MGSIWIAAHMRLHTQVLVKILSPQFRHDSRVRARFFREARLGELIGSPYLVRNYEFGTMPSDEPFIIMEWLQGASLGDRLKDGPLRLDTVADVAVQLGIALEHLHESGVVHRDVKPDNIFLLQNSPTTALKLLDLGIAKDASGQLGLDDEDLKTDPNQALGTAQYMSPEQLRGADNVDARADIWSMAVVAYLMLLQRSPFNADDFPSIVAAICSGDYEPPSHVAPHWPPELDQWFAACFQVDRDARPGSTRAAGGDLAAILRQLVRPSMNPTHRTSNIPR